MMSEREHQSVLLNESIDGLITDKDGVYIDGTFGRGGHSEAILQRLSTSGRLLSIDKDLDAMNSAKAQQLREDSRFELEHGSFAEMCRFVEQRKWQGKVSGVLLDLGVSSPQIDQAERGFSFMQNGPLDMRMNQTQGQTAAQWLKHVSESDLTRVLRDYGEEKMARKIAQAIVETREEAPLETTEQLSSLIASVIKKREQKKHPATRSFQAIRIKINEELSDIEAVLAASLDVLKVSGRLAVISFHSLEDRIVKRFMRENSRGPVVPRHLPLPTGIAIPPLKLVGKAIKASEVEVSDNVRSRSAVLRIAERT